MLILWCGIAVAAQLNLNVANRPLADFKRDVTSKPEDIIMFSGVSSGNTVLDVLGGSGYYSELISQVVGEHGKVYLHNNKAYMPYVQKQLEARLKDERLVNVVRHDKELDALALPNNSIDFIFFVMGYHDIYHTAQGWKINKEQFISQLHASLKVGGKLLVIAHDAVKGSGNKSSQEIHRIEQQFVIDDLTTMGFQLVKSTDLLKNPNDTLTQSVFTEGLRGKTSRFVLLFEKI